LHDASAPPIASLRNGQTVQVSWRQQQRIGVDSKWTAVADWTHWLVEVGLVAHDVHRCDRANDWDGRSIGVNGQLLGAAFERRLRVFLSKYWGIGVDVFLLPEPQWDGRSWNQFP